MRGAAGAGAARGRATARRLAHAAVALVGLLVLLYPLTIGAHPRVSCRGVPIAPGQACAKADNRGAQTYEQRLRTANQARPVIVGVGLLVAVFGAVLLAADVRPRRKPGERPVEDTSGRSS